MKIKLILGLLSLMLLACGTLEQLQNLNRQPDVSATGAVIINQSGHLAAEAWQKTDTLPGYRLEIRHRHETAGREQIITTIFDAAGNVHARRLLADGTELEYFQVDGHVYQFQAQYQGWVDTGRDIPTQAGELVSPAELLRMLIQIGTAPTQTGHELLHDRPATRYKLSYVTAEMARLFDQPAGDLPLDVRGTLWLDDKTGALVKSEIFLYRRGLEAPTQRFNLDVSQLGRVDPITPPEPIIDPQAVIAATATAQAWTVVETMLTYQGQPVTFELIPLEAHQIPDSSPRQTGVAIKLRRIPGIVFAAPEPFLAQLRGQLRLSVPNQNLVVTSSGYELQHSSRPEQTIDLIYFFNANLEDFAHTELVISGQGNPQYAPVPVVTGAAD